MLYSSQRKATVHRATKVHTHHFTNTGVTQVTATMLENTDIPKKSNASGTPRGQYRAHFTKVQHTSQTMHFEYLFTQWASTLVNKIPWSYQCVPSELTVSHKRPQPNKKIQRARHTQHTKQISRKCNTHPTQVIIGTGTQSYQTPFQRRTMRPKVPA
jgi:hypothetical protein